MMKLMLKMVKAIHPLLSLGKSFHFETILIQKRIFVAIESCAFHNDDG